MEIYDYEWIDDELWHEKNKEDLHNTPEQIPFGQLPKGKMDLVGLSKYASAKEVRVSELSEEEKERFIQR